MVTPPPEVARSLASLRSSLGARAAGVWRVEVDELIQLAFDATPDMPAEVAARFASATFTVPLDRRELGIVAAVESARRVVSRAEDLPPDSGSGYWLRAFGADRSVAVPIAGPTGIAGVVSVALAGSEWADDAVEALLRERASEWFSRG
jgi:hypothetical protein